MLLTIFTPTYNRIETIDRLYKSLVNQTNHLFEWVVIDDGSDDNTEHYFNKMNLANTPFKVNYKKVLNGGKHRAINKGVEIAEGEYFFIVDSDDWLPANSIEFILSWLGTIAIENKKFAGISGLKGYDKKQIVGKTFKGTYVDCSALNRHKFNVFGDKSEVYKTSLLRKYKFPEIEGENFMTESVVWNRMAADGYYIRYINEINYICAYLEDGLTKNIDKTYVENLKGYSLYVREYLQYQKSVVLKTRMIMAYGYRGRKFNLSYNKLAGNLGISVAKMFLLSNLGLLYKILKA
ncbi:glycosyltransferase family 2 protein [Planomicrobium okeanokoites]|uniref:glycosyltransferase family 2 protein n=1 Tax=Planomicrobium okeanokoites TaxID=244 RepID=UPI0024935EB4|nr:glycosyltransferase family 2 protein [Planomicrobium okeanokoites]